MQPEEDRSLDDLKRELAELIKGQEASIPVVKIPPGTTTRDGRDVSGMWLWGALAPLWIFSWNLRRKRELEELISRLEPHDDNEK